MRAIQLITIVGIAAVASKAESASLRQQQYDEDNPNIFGKSRKRNTSNDMEGSNFLFMKYNLQECPLLLGRY